MTGLNILPVQESNGPEADRFADAPHPAEMLSLVGHQAAEFAFMDAWRSGRVHHAWLIGGEEGIGKATLAYRIARFVLANPDGKPDATTLDVAASHPVCHQIAAHAHPDLAIIRRSLNKEGKALRTEISVDDVRHGLEVFTKTASMGGYRICIVDACDELNASSANALLKTLEEPPVKGLFLLVAHQPNRLLPTIRSRCRVLPLRALEMDEVAHITSNLPAFADQPFEVHQRAAELSGGSVRRALSVLDLKKLAFNDRVQAVFQRFPRIDTTEIDAIAEQTTGRNGDDAFYRFCEICEGWLSSELIRRPHEPQALAPLSEAWTRLNEAKREVDIYNLDRRPFVIAMIAELAETARN